MPNPKYLIDKQSRGLFEGAPKSDFDVLSARVDQIEANQTAASGYEIATQTQEVAVSVSSTDKVISYTFTVPSGSIILESSYKSAYGGDNVPWKTVDIKTWLTSTTVQLQVNNYTDASRAILKLVYAYAVTQDLSELTDIRIGADGTTYETAGDAVRAQVNGLQSEIESVQESLPEIVPFQITMSATIGTHGILSNISVDRSTEEIESASGQLIYIALQMNGSEYYIYMSSFSNNTLHFEFFECTDPQDLQSGYVHGSINYSMTSHSFSGVWVEY